MLAAREDPARMRRIVEQSAVPMLMVDNERRYVEVNLPARLFFRRSLAEMRRLRAGDLTPGEERGSFEAAWKQLLTEGCVAGFYEFGFPDGSREGVLYWAIANATPGLHLSIFAPASWPEDELGSTARRQSSLASGLTPRELEVLRLAAEGVSGPKIAALLDVTPATIKTHFANIYAKLGVSDRAAAVARAMRIGLID